MSETIWSLLPPVLAIFLALATKEVYFSLLLGILSGALLLTNFHLAGALEVTVTIMGEKVGAGINILIFLVLLGMLVALMSKSGASAAYGKWAASSIRTRRGALFATSGLGALIFVDDYFNCLTVGTVMSPVTDRHKISRAKLAYIIDATAAPVCILAPISSWAAAVGSSLPEGSAIDGFTLFLKTIPFNLYALLTIVMLAFLIFFGFDFGKMKKYEKAHQKNLTAASGEMESGPAKKGRVFDLVLPILALILFCVAAMLYTGGILEGASPAAAFAACDAPLSLVLGSFFAIVFIFLLYLPRRVITFTQFAESLTEGFRAMVPAILILTLAWTLSGICSEGYLNAGGFVSRVVQENQFAHGLIPALFFTVATGLAFATGTSWGTFGILIPIAVSVFGGAESQILVITVAAVLAGAVCGDHISPISDTTILASTGAGCSHIDHVATQMPYALLVAAVSFVGYLVAGFTQNGFLALGTSLVLLLGALSLLYVKSKNQPEK